MTTNNDAPFSLEQIRAAHARVKSGADFPAYIRDIKALGVLHYDHFVTDGHIRYTGARGFTIDAAAKWPEVPVAIKADATQLKKDLAAHQQGQSDYLTFCRQAAAAGVEKWTTDIEAMRCTYYSNPGETLLTEEIPG